MFQLPDAKRVRRENIYDSDPEPEDREGHVDDGPAQARLKERLASLLAFDVPDPLEALGKDDEGDVEPAAPAAQEVFEFRLFASSGSGSGNGKKGGGHGPAVARVILPPEPEAGVAAGDESREGGFVVPRRPLSHYVAGEPSSEEKERFRLSAVTGEDILLRSAQRCWGLEVPWRVTKVNAHSKGGKMQSGSPFSSSSGTLKVVASSGMVGDQTIQKKKKRPGKKRRIAIRIKSKAEKEKVEGAAKSKLTKEEHLKEKKKRLNREKKLKRRQKEREKKKQASNSEDIRHGDGDSESGDD